MNQISITTVLILMSSPPFLANEENECDQDHGLKSGAIICPDPDGECSKITISYSGNDDLSDNTKSFLGEYDYVGKSVGNGATIYRHEYKLKFNDGNFHEDFAYLVKIGKKDEWNKDASWKVVKTFEKKLFENTVIKSNDCKEESVLDCKENWSITGKHEVNNNGKKVDWIEEGIKVECANSMSMASIVGIVAGVVVLIVIIAIIVVLVVKKRRNNENHDKGKPPGTGM